VADSSNSGNNSSPDVADNPAGYTGPQQPTDNLPGPNKGKLAETTRQHQQQADQQEALANGAGFQFDPDELRHLRDEWQDLTRELLDLQNQATYIGQALPPAEDDASMNQIKATKTHAKLCTEMHEQMYQYAKTYTDRLDEAIKHLKSTDDEAARTIKSTGNNV